MPRVPDQVTPAEIGDVLPALYRAWVEMFDKPPANKDAIVLLASHSAFESGWWKSMHCWNFGNSKTVPGAYPGKEWTFFRCYEVLTAESAERYVARGNGLAKIRGPSKTVAGSVIVDFFPDHPACCFSAYRDLQHGVDSYLRMIFTRYNRSWNAVITGSPVTFANELKMDGYYTADPTVVGRELERVYKMVAKIPFSLAELPVLSEARKKELLVMVGETSRSLVQELMMEDLLNDRDDM